MNRQGHILATALLGLTAIAATTTPTQAATTPTQGAWNRHHNYANPAWDINVPGSSDCGALVRSTRSGRAEVHRWGYSYGNHVRVAGSLYAHLSHIRVNPGQRVRVGQVIGRVGQSGNAHGCHLHYEIGV